ncbi:MAG: DUF6691 family protein [Myxococcota bacterium]
MIRNYVLVFLSGTVFAVGLAVGGMTQPAKVVSFLDLFGDWDPSLAFVMGGAILAYFPLYQVITKRNTPLFAARFLIPERADLDWRLLTGAAVFGVGWGLGGFCPGPALTAAGALAPAALVFSAAMIGGFLLHWAFDAMLSRRATHRARTPTDARTT